MPKIIPFSGIHYNPEMISDLSTVVTPPYDNIPESDIKSYLNRSPYNFAHVILPKEKEDSYATTRQLLERWREQRILVQDSSPSLYLYQQTFLSKGQSHSRCTLIAAVELSPFSDGKLRPHEQVHDRHREDRLRILRQTQCNLSPVFAMIKDPTGTLASLYERWVFERPLLHARTKDGIEHTLWRIDASRSADVEAFCSERPLYIVDGHHRCLSALHYAQEQGVVGTSSPAAYMLFAIATASDPALIVYPTHRYLRSTENHEIGWESVDSVFSTVPAGENDLRRFTQSPSHAPTFALWLERQLYLCTPRAAHTTGVEKLAVFWSDEKILGQLFGISPEQRSSKIIYEQDWEVIWKNRQSVPVAIFHAPPAIPTILELADGGICLPQKTTFFYPKIAAGLILRDVSQR